MDTHRSRWAGWGVPAGVYLTGLAVQGGLIVYFLTHLDAAILRLMPDDAFYYLKIAENIASGLGSVFSPGEPSNGYHPLWMGLLVTLHWLLRPTPPAFIAVVLAAAVACNLVTAELLRRYVRHIGLGEVRAWLAAAAYLLLPWTVYLTLTGLETPLFLGCLIAFLWVAQRIVDGAAPLSWRDAGWLGLTAGLVMLARTDAIFFTAPAFVYILIRQRIRCVPRLVAAGLLASALLAPWLLWNYANFGSVMQSSSDAISRLHHFWFPDPFHADYWTFARGMYTNGIYWALFYPLISHPRFMVYWAWWPQAAWLLTAAVVGVAALCHVRGRPLRLPGLWVYPALALVFFYCAIRLFTQLWHLSPLFPLAIVYALNFMPRLRRVHVGWAMPLLVALTIYAAQNAYIRPQEWDGRVAYFQTIWPDSAPDGQKVCITDAGIPGYFARRHEVVNLDGLVNTHAYHAILAGRFSEYTAAIGCDVVILDERRLAYYDRNMP